jgi:hypothetical protein
MASNNVQGQGAKGTATRFASKLQLQRELDAQLSNVVSILSRRMICRDEILALKFFEDPDEVDPNSATGSLKERLWGLPSGRRKQQYRMRRQY